MENRQSRARTGCPCLSVAKVPPDCAVHIPPILGGHPRTGSRGETPYYSAPYPTHTPMEDKLKYRAAGKKVIEWLKAWKSTNIRSKSSWSGVSNLVMTL